ncbi:MAG: hypothetical protein ABI082_08270 [Dokdonella sp.]
MTLCEEEITVAGLRTIAVGNRDATMLVILCHGFAMNPEDLAPFAHSLGVSARWLFPEAPLPAELEPGLPHGRSWWHIDPALRLAALSCGPRDFAGVQPPDLAAARALLGAFVDAAFGLADGRPVVLGGFSSGGMLAFDTQLHSPRPISALVLLSSTRIDWSDQQPLLAASPLLGLPTLCTHGRADADLSFEAGLALRDAATVAGADVTWLPFDGGHDIPLVAWRAVHRLLRAHEYNSSRLSADANTGPLE